MSSFLTTGFESILSLLLRSCCWKIVCGLGVSNHFLDAQRRKEGEGLRLLIINHLHGHRLLGSPLLMFS